ncbi:bifunctional metallophosphatase/5'-nucleotidase [Virgibacillus salinus]|uniref:2',3'-cyclic-nucleotide 2'-phosphodiesterase/5'-or 3'-nucleotidase, 5'-nucleotidase family n=1 Tax=Virgibacillus salinus TaxID=553311 RepID=A0A1H0ZKU7_9BACI|nr:bifunctional UDP-sugar hydrolase/5'-nucleotidase [Virgibacillus salinus]SDQ28118.1 2',3'-cyclic-nucleotide 2'-phosphodiesterase/5'-or 3'-nucleotidase, 5'-nucleotidase family [Virgibacillus salinus]
MQEKLYFYYTNDLHSYFENWSRVAGYLKEEKERKTAEGNSCWLIDIGDHVDRVNPIAEAFMGKANVSLMNDVGYDLATIGNNEGITLAHDDLHHLYDDANFQVVCANMQSLTGTEPNWLQPTVEIKSVNGVRIGIIGLTAPFNAFYELLDWHISIPLQALEEHITKLKESTDVIILLSHLGITEDQEIARRFDDIDIIIGGHTHHLLRTGEMINNTIITAAGKHCTFVGEVILTWDHSLQKLVNKEAYTKDTTHMAKDLHTEQTLIELTEKADKILGETVVHLDNPVEIKWFRHTHVMQKLTDTLREWTKADVAMLNAGVLLDQLPAGNITYKDIHRICPHPINPCVVELKGDELLEVVRASFTKELTELKLKGFGFRGEVIGRMIYSGLKVDTFYREDGHEYVEQVTWNGEALDQNKSYTVATADTFTFGRLLPEVAKSKTKKYFLPEFLRDLLAQTLRNDFV